MKIERCLWNKQCNLMQQYWFAEKYKMMTIYKSFVQSLICIESIMFNVFLIKNCFGNVYFPNLKIWSSKSESTRWKSLCKICSLKTTSILREHEAAKMTFLLSYFMTELCYLARLSKPDRSNRSNREPDLHSVRLVRKTVLRGNRDQTGKTGIKPEKTGDPAGPTGLEV
jgi:hypothetical protein